jgi:hypothetical protein
MAGQPSAVTRYLCAGAYLDDDFARAVLDEVVSDPHRGVAPAPGVDVETVARHCLAAVRRGLRRDVVICVILLAIAVTAGLRGILVVAWLCSTLLVLRSIRSLARGELSAAFSQFLVFLLISAVCAVGLLAQLARNRTGLVPDLGTTRLVPVDSFTLLILVVLVLWAVGYLDRVSQFGVLTETLAADRFAPDPSFPATGTAESDRLAYLAAAQGSALSVYAASAGPFVGFGPVVHGWTASSRLTGSAPDAASVYAAVREAFSDGRFEVRDLVVVPGWLPRTHPFVEDPPARPVAAIPAAIVADIARRPAGTESYHLALHLPSPTGETAVTGLLRAEVSGGLLTVDVALTALPPVVARYRSIDAPRPGGPVVMAQMLGAALIDIVRVVPRAPLSLYANLRRALLPRLTPRAEASTDLGARAGVRELGTDRHGGQAQEFEATRAANVVSRTVLEAVTTLLERHGHDSADFARAADAVWHKTLDRPGDALSARSEG